MHVHTYMASSSNHSINLVVDRIMESVSSIFYGRGGLLGQ